MELKPTHTSPHIASYDSHLAEEAENKLWSQCD